MGQKVHPTGIRLGIVKDHTSVWYADKKSYADYLLNDLEVRQYLRKRLAALLVCLFSRRSRLARVGGHCGVPRALLVIIEEDFLVADIS